MDNSTDDRERLVQWMKDNGYDYRTLAAATGDPVSQVHMITSGARSVSDAFKFRFFRAFGQEELNKAFGMEMAVKE